MTTVLYLSDTGLMEPLGQSQILPYLRSLSANRRIVLVSLEKLTDLNDAARTTKLRKAVLEANIVWIPVHYRGGLVGPLLNWLAATLAAIRSCWSSGAHIVHARGFIPAVWALSLKRLFRCRFIFDVRGVSWVERRVELGTFKKDSVALTFARFLEKRVLREADTIVTLSEGAAEQMRQWPVISERPDRLRVITTCTDLRRFADDPSSAHIGRGAFTLGYVGNAGPGYLFESAIDLFLAVRSFLPDARLKIVNRKEHDLIRECLRERAVDQSCVEVSSCEFDEVPNAMRAMDAGVFFYRWPSTEVPPVFTRMGEFLAAGIPCVSNVAGIGKLDILRSEHVGVVVDPARQEELNAAAQELLALRSDAGLRERCIAAAAQHFSLDAGVAAYERIYTELGPDNIVTSHRGMAA